MSNKPKENAVFLAEEKSEHNRGRGKKEETHNH